MYPLFETICVKDGVIQNSEWHQKRYAHSYEAYYSKKAPRALIEGITVPTEFSSSVSKLRISYNEFSRKIEFEKSTFVIGKTLKLVHVDDIDYSLKYSNRNQLNNLFARRGTCDDVLISKNGMITDTTYANIVFTDGMKWYTPSTPLLKGTCREKLLEEGQIFEKDISVNDLDNYIGFNLINAMNDLNKKYTHKIENIVR